MGRDLYARDVNFRDSHDLGRRTYGPVQSSRSWSAHPLGSCLGLSANGIQPVCRLPADCDFRPAFFRAGHDEPLGRRRHEPLVPRSAWPRALHRFAWVFHWRSLFAGDLREFDERHELASSLDHRRPDLSDIDPDADGGPEKRANAAKYASIGILAWHGWTSLDPQSGAEAFPILVHGASLAGSVRIQYGVLFSSGPFRRDQWMGPRRACCSLPVLHSLRCRLDDPIRLAARPFGDRPYHSVLSITDGGCICRFRCF